MTDLRAHGVHDACPVEADHVPAPHGAHPSCPVSGWYKPTAHGVHATVALVQYFPASHAVHSPPETRLIVPVEQEVHDDDPSPDDLPAAQSEQGLPLPALALPADTGG